MSKEILKEKIDQAVDILNEKEIDMWLTFVRESSTIKDPSIDMIIGTGCTWQSAYMISKDGDTTAILGSLDVENMKAEGKFKNIVSYLKSIKEPLLDYLNQKQPEKIAVNFSMNNNLADGLTHGMYLILLDHLKGSGFEDKLISSEEIVAALRGRKSTTEISLMKKAIKETLKIFDEVTNFIKPGVTEKRIANFIKQKVNERGLGLAWDEGHCPAVFTGPGTAGAHAGPTERKVERGHVLNIDFGVKYKEYCSDLQRTWYIRKKGEKKVPDEVLRGFNVIRDSIQMVAEKLRPGVQGCEMDDIARNYIVSMGYEEYPHGLGHPIGRSAHDAGALMAPRWERYGNVPYMRLEESQVYTIEPRLTIEGYGIATIEEEVLITKNGCEFLSTPQKKIFLI